MNNSHPNYSLTKCKNDTETDEGFINPLPRAVLRPNSFVLLDGNWNFEHDPKNVGLAESWYVSHKYTGTAEDPEARIAGPIGYDLVPIQTSLWPRARQHASKKGLRYGRTHNYGSIKLNLVSKGGTAPRTVKIGSLGSSFLGTVGGRNMARPPWGWFDMNRRTDPLGLWFFDPAAVVKRDLNLAEGFSTIYVRLPFWATVK